MSLLLVCCIRELVAAGLHGEQLLAAIDRLQACNANETRETRNETHRETPRTSTERVRAWRNAKKHQGTTGDNGQPCNVDETRSETRETVASVSPSVASPPSPPSPLCPPFPLEPLTPPISPQTTPSPEKSLEARGAFSGDCPAISPTEPEPAAAKPQAKARTRQLPPPAKPANGTRLPPDWTPSEADIAFAAQHLTPEESRHEADKFRDYWIAQPGQRGRKLDWAATWRTWCRRAAERKPARSSGYGAASPDGGRRLTRQEIADRNTATTIEILRDIQRASANGAELEFGGDDGTVIYLERRGATAYG